MQKPFLPPLRVGLTGGIACGKSTAAAFFQELGVSVLDADAINQQLLQPHACGWQTLIEYFGREVLNPDQSVNKNWLREKIFSDPEARTIVENLLHPLIWQEMEKEYQAASSSYVVFMVPLLLEKQHQQKMDRVLLVDCHPSVQRQRLAQRPNLRLDLIEKILSVQLSRPARLKMVNDCLNSAQALIQLKASVALLHDFYQKISKK